MGQRSFIRFEKLEARTLAASFGHGLELWWGINLLRVLGYEGANRLGVSSGLMAKNVNPPLAWNSNLYQCASGHANEMAEHNYFAHPSAVSGTWPNQRVRDSGYPLPTVLADGRNDVEVNLAGFGLSNPDAALVEILRDNNAQTLLFPNNTSTLKVTESAVGFASSPESSFDHYWTLLIAGRSQGERFLTGVVYNDSNNNKLFDAGEGIGGIKVQSGELAVTTTEHGDYALAVGGGRHNLEFTSAAGVLLAKATVVVGEKSIAVDLRQDDAAVEINYRIRSVWTNHDIHVDVNRDRNVNAIDALVVINHLNRNGSGLLGDGSANQIPANAIDTTGDSYASAIDALVVINHLNRQ